MKKILLISFLSLLSLTQNSFSKNYDNNLNLPKGFEISIFADNITQARQMTLSKNGTLFVGTRGRKVFAISKDKKVYTIADKLFAPNGVAIKGNDLYVAEVDKISKYENIEKNLAIPPKPQTIYTGLNSNTHHGYRYIKFSPEGKLYISIGVPCNICEPKEEKLGTISRINDDGSNFEIYAKGIRNSMGFDWSNKKELWFTDNGRDMLGDDLPPEEINRATQKGQNFGYPYCHSGYISDPEFGKKHSCNEFKKPEIKLNAHVAPLGLTFYKGNKFSTKYNNQIFIAEHGSWNRSSPIGYRISTIFLKDNKVIENKVFLDGWLKDGSVSGRPVDIINYIDGSILVSDDYANRIYQIKYIG
ncbi:MAG: PQQ-dependent sugar dehydrogenase [Candidatus Sericytochromatia bacterium]